MKKYLMIVFWQCREILLQSFISRAPFKMLVSMVASSKCERLIACRGNKSEFCELLCCHYKKHGFFAATIFFNKSKDMPVTSLAAIHQRISCMKFASLTCSYSAAAAWRHGNDSALAFFFFFPASCFVADCTLSSWACLKSRTSDATWHPYGYEYTVCTLSRVCTRCHSLKTGHGPGCERTVVEKCCWYCPTAAASNFFLKNASVAAGWWWFLCTASETSTANQM